MGFGRCLKVTLRKHTPKNISSGQFGDEQPHRACVAGSEDPNRHLWNRYTVALIRKLSLALHAYKFNKNMSKLYFEYQRDEKADSFNRTENIK